MGEAMEGIEQQFQWAVQALTQPANVQPTLFPSFVVVADELALDFDNWRRAFEAHFAESWSSQQRKAVHALDQLLDRMSRGRPRLWHGKECLKEHRWSEVRQLAGDVLKAFGWSSDIPPTGRALYARCPPESETLKKWR
jgi:hypothetical protein